MNDDVAVEDSLYTAGRRGVAATILLNKIAGAAADEGRDLAAVAEVSRKVIGNGRSMGMALTSCTVPAAGRPTFDLPDDQMEVGIGVHGEPGRRRLPIAPAREVAEMLVEPILKDLDFTGGDGVSPSSTAWAAPRCSSSTSCTARSPGSWTGPACRWPAPWSGTT